MNYNLVTKWGGYSLKTSERGSEASKVKPYRLSDSLGGDS